VPGPKLNESPVLRRRPTSRAVAVSAPTPSARAVARYVRVSPYKVREVLDLVRGHDAQRAQEILRFSERDSAALVGKVLASAVANAERDPHNLVADELYVSACFADEGPTLKRWRPRARGRATRIRKRTCHITVIVSRLPDRELQARRAQRAQAVTGRRGRRPGAAPSQADQGRGGRRRRGQAPEQAAAPATQEQPPTPEAEAPDAAAPETAAPETAAPETAASETAASDAAGAPDRASSGTEGASPELQAAADNEDEE
jgi:large subunit ribosomal protein L22